VKPDNNFLRDIFVSSKKILFPENQRDSKEIDALPLRAELFSALQMEQHGRILANTHTLSTGWVRDHLLSRLADNEAVIIDTCNQLTAAVKIGRQVTPGAEWLLDNFYLIEGNYSAVVNTINLRHSAGNDKNSPITRAKP
jgi:cyclic beta-1,2-glucan synthetase